MKVAKPSKEILNAVTAFVQASEAMLEKGAFDLKSPYENWQDWDDDDEDKILMLRIRKSVAANEDMKESEIDGRILAYEFLRAKYTNRLSHVNLTVNVLMGNCCDPMEDTLEFHPSFEQRHVAPEQ